MVGKGQVLGLYKSSWLVKNPNCDFPGGPVVKTMLAQVRSLVKEPGSHVSCSVAKKKKTKTDMFLTIHLVHFQIINDAHPNPASYVCPPLLSAILAHLTLSPQRGLPLFREDTWGPLMAHGLCPPSSHTSHSRSTTGPAMLPHNVADHAATFPACVHAWKPPFISDACLTQLVSLPAGSLHWLNHHPAWIPCPSFHSHQVSVLCTVGFSGLTSGSGRSPGEGNGFHSHKGSIWGRPNSRNQ